MSLGSMPFSSQMYAELQSRFPSKFISTEILVEPGLIAFLNACFEFADEGPEETQRSSLANLPKVFASHLRGLSEVAVVRLCAITGR